MLIGRGMKHYFRFVFFEFHIQSVRVAYVTNHNAEEISRVVTSQLMVNKIEPVFVAVIKYEAAGVMSDNLPA